MLNSILIENVAASVTGQEFFICLITALAAGICIALIHMYHNQYTKNFILTLTLMPAIVQIVIMLVNGNLGTGVAVMGAFSLVRFRSVPGNSREIGSIFLAMASGLATGMGYIGITGIFIVIIGAVTLVLNAVPYGESRQGLRSLKVTIPENLDYSGIFDDIFQKYTKSAKLLRVKTTNMGSMYELHYHMIMKNMREEKQMLDEIRCRNGNLTIICGQLASDREEL